jgi:hypothetical protein
VVVYDIYIVAAALHERKGTRSSCKSCSVTPKSGLAFVYLIADVRIWAFNGDSRVTCPPMTEPTPSRTESR